MKKFMDFFNETEVVVLDGGMSTSLENLGITMSNPVWNAAGLIAAPELVKKAHRLFFEAGSNVVITNSYFCSSWIFRSIGFDVNESKDYLALSVKLAQEAREEATGKQEKFVAGGISCYGVQFSNLSEYHGDYDVPDSEYKAYHKERMDIFYENGVDLFAIETIPNYKESLVLLDLLKEYPDMVAYFSSTLSDAEHLGDGTPYSELRPLLEDHPQIIAYGTNCVKPQIVEEYLEKYSKDAKKPFVAYPNGFNSYDPDKKEFTGPMVDFKQLFNEEALEWKNLGCKLIGGCCGSDWNDIEVLVEVFN